MFCRIFEGLDKNWDTQEHSDSIKLMQNHLVHMRGAPDFRPEIEQCVAVLPPRSFSTG